MLDPTPPSNPAITQPPSIPFEAWMQKALFDPASGYYSHHIRTVGRNGDFSTSATTSTLLAKGISHWIKNQPHQPAIIEIGGGNGTLMRDIRRTLGWWKSRRHRWHMVETSPVLQSRQRETLGSNITWHSSLHEALQTCSGNALIYHNELVDAFPVRLLQWSATSWQEIHLHKPTPTSPWQESLHPIPPTSIHFSALTHPPSHPQQRIELHQSYHLWLQSWAPLWKNGAMLTIDYGDTFPQLYHRKPSGNLRSYFHHQTLVGNNIYLNMGKQDITCDVNFTDLIHWGNQLGWQHLPLQTQRNFLLPFTPQKTTTADQYLLDEYGAGTAFKVLVQTPCKPIAS